MPDLNALQVLGQGATLRRASRACRRVRSRRRAGLQGRQLGFHRRDVLGQGLVEQTPLFGRHALGLGGELHPPQPCDLGRQRADARIAQHDGAITFAHDLALALGGVQGRIAFGLKGTTFGQRLIAFGTHAVTLQLVSLHGRRQQRLRHRAQLRGIVNAIQ